MSYKIFGDSCLDLTEELKKDPRFEMIPLTLQVDDHMIMDDETFDQKAFLQMVKESPNCPKTACPSPEAFKKACECDADDVYIIGGESVYRQFLPYCDEAQITWIDFAYAADTHFPNLDQDAAWEMVQESDEQTYFDLCYEYRLYKKK